MSNNTAPDSWEQQADAGAGSDNSPMDSADVTAKFSTLNVNAVEFVPSFGVKTAQSEEHDSPTKSEESDNSPVSIDHSPMLNGMTYFIHFFYVLVL